MRWTLILCVGALLTAAPASAHDKPTKVFKAKLSSEGDSDARGRAHLVDGRKHDKVSLHMKGLEPGKTYVWQVREGSCGEEGAASEGWTYRDLKVRPSGNANAKARSSEFSAGHDDYAVEVRDEAGTVVACGEFERKRGGRKGDDRKGHDREKKGHEKKGHGRGHDKPHHDD